MTVRIDLQEPAGSAEITKLPSGISLSIFLNQYSEYGGIFIDAEKNHWVPWHRVVRVNIKETKA